MKFDCREDIIQLTPQWKGERFPNGRPRVPDDILCRMYSITLEEAFRPVLRNGYKYQFQGSFGIVHPDKKLIGRAVTAVMVPLRPDLHDCLMQYGYEHENRSGFFNQWVIDQLVEDDVVVVDLFDKVQYGTYVGGNLSTAIAARTKRGGAVIWGGMRDLEQVMKIENSNTFYRGTDPTAIGDVTMVGMNTPCRIGNAICMPGDVVFGSRAGVVFIPPHLAEEVVVTAEKTHILDIWGFIRIEEKAYTTAQIDNDWPVALWEDFLNWFHTDELAVGYRHLTWDSEIEEARKNEAEGKQRNLII